MLQDMREIPEELQLELELGLPRIPRCMLESVCRECTGKQLNDGGQAMCRQKVVSAKQ